MTVENLEIIKGGIPLMISKIEAGTVSLKDIFILITRDKTPSTSLYLCPGVDGVTSNFSQNPHTSCSHPDLIAGFGYFEARLTVGGQSGEIIIRGINKP